VSAKAAPRRSAPFIDGDATEAPRPPRRSAHSLPEAFVWWLWQNGLAGRHLVTVAGQALHVIYPGRRWGSWGPDFRGALISLDGEITRGDVEVHVRARDWFAHGHHRDPAYDTTILHVVFHTAGTDPAALPPLVALDAHLRQPLASLRAQWEDGALGRMADACLPVGIAVPLLRRAGLARLEAKAARFEGDLAVLKPEGALIRGLVEGLGYATNVAPMRSLLERLSPEWVRDLIRVEGEHVAESLVFGEAGLLPSQLGRLPLDEPSRRAESAWRARGDEHASAKLGWRRIGGRPANSPERRVAAALALIGRGDQLGDRILGVLSEMPPARAGGTLRDTLMVAGNEYWRAHFGFGRLMRAPSGLVGEQRASDLVVNVALPWALAVARAWANPMLEQSVIDAYEAHPALASNQITRHMAAQVLGDQQTPVLRSACLQQGLIQLYRGWCDARDCLDCPARVIELATIHGGQ
jgi:hypothetical protein